MIHNGRAPFKSDFTHSMKLQYREGEIKKVFMEKVYGSSK